MAPLHGAHCNPKPYSNPNREVNGSDGGSSVGHIIRWLVNGDHMLAIRKDVAYGW